MCSFCPYNHQLTVLNTTTTFFNLILQTQTGYWIRRLTTLFDYCMYQYITYYIHNIQRDECLPRTAETTRLHCAVVWTT